MNKVFKVHKIADIVDSKKYGKSRVELELHNYGKEVFWLSHKQTYNLIQNFGSNDYSTAKKTVYVVLEEKEDGKYRYIWSGVNEKGLGFLVENFNAELANVL